MPVQVSISSVGMTSSLGAGANDSCAAARAGIVRLSELIGANVLEEESGEMLPILGHLACGGVASSFQGVGRLIELSRLALEDLSSASSINDSNPIPVLVAVGGDYYLRKYLEHELGDAEDSLSFPLPEIVEAESLSFKNSVNSQFLQRLAGEVEIPLDVSNSRILFGEQASVAKILSFAERFLQENNLPAVIVGGVDTLVDEARLQQLVALELLKTPVLDTGFFPGEAAAFVILEKTATAKSSSASIRQVSVAEESNHRLSGELCYGEILAGVVRSALSTSGADQAMPGLIIDNLNGDQWQSWDWGHALSRLAEVIGDVRQWHPAEAFGEIGAATLPVMLCMAARAFERDYARTDSILACITGSDGAKAGVLVSRSN